MHDRLVLGRLALVAERHGLELVADTSETTSSDRPAATPMAETPIAAVADLGLAHAVERIAAWRQRWPDALLAASIGLPDQELWHGAIAAGADLVANRGSFAVRFDSALTAREGESGVAESVIRLPVRLMERSGDGLIGRLPDAPDGPIAVFRVRDRMWAIRDECPHAGASLADGDLDGTVITCPRHGSQFDVTTGSRERGPSDFPIRTYRVWTTGDATWVEVPG